MSRTRDLLPRTAADPWRRPLLQLSEMGWAVPAVVTHRLTRLALAGPLPSQRDLREIDLMVNEKALAFFAAGWAMWRQAFESHQTLLLRAWSEAWQPSAFWDLPTTLLSQGTTLWPQIVGQGLAPVHRRVLGNVRRLGSSQAG